MSIYNTNNSDGKSYHESVVEAYPEASYDDIMNGRYGVQNRPRPGDDLSGIYVPQPSLKKRIKAVVDTILAFFRNLKS